MLSLRKPSAERLDAFLDAQSKLDFTYTAVGATSKVPPPGYTVDHTRIKLGEGIEAYVAAQAALKRWQHFQLGWVESWPPDAPIQVGQPVAVLAHLLGTWMTSAARIVYTIDEDGPVKRFGFAYGTLPDHPESGEERFTIEWSKSDGSVWYDILAFSRPNQLLTRLAYPLVRRFQRRFARDSGAVMMGVVKPA
jgi:uncharacterized protein (UPF0548 family)